MPAGGFAGGGRAGGRLFAADSLLPPLPPPSPPSPHHLAARPLLLPAPCPLPRHPRPQDFLCGIRGKDFVLVCSDTCAVQSVVRMKLDEDKLVPVDSHKLFALSGEAGDRVNFSEYIIANVRLYALRNAAQLSTKAVANYTRSELATALRKVGAPGAAVGGGRISRLGWRGQGWAGRKEKEERLLASSRNCPAAAGS